MSRGTTLVPRRKSVFSIFFSLLLINNLIFKYLLWNSNQRNINFHKHIKRFDSQMHHYSFLMIRFKFANITANSCRLARVRRCAWLHVCYYMHLQNYCKQLVLACKQRRQAYDLSKQIYACERRLDLLLSIYKKYCLLYFLENFQILKAICLLLVKCFFVLVTINCKLLDYLQYILLYHLFMKNMTVIYIAQP